LAALLGTPTDNAGQAPLQPAAPARAELHIARLDEHDDEDGGHAAGETSPNLTLNVYDIDDNPFQPRREFNESEIASLAESLKQHDLLQPILVRRVGERYQLISGKRRLRAAIQAGWTTIPARLREADDRLVAELAIVENLQRKDLNPIEKALSFRRYLDQHQCTQEELAGRLKIDRATIANLMRLLELPETVQKALGEGAISAGHARALLPLGDEREQIEFCRRIQAEGLSVRDTEQQVRETIETLEAANLGGVAAGAGKKRRRRATSDQVAALERELRIALGTKTEIRQGSRGRGRIVIHYADHDEFERIRTLLIENGGLDVTLRVG
jgi:ParB family chromosome partitioning protein